MVLRECDQPTPFSTDLHHVGNDNSLETRMSAEELEKAMIGRVTAITENTTRRDFRSGEVISEDEIKRVYAVDVVVGTTKAQLLQSLPQTQNKQIIMSSNLPIQLNVFCCFYFIVPVMNCALSYST